MLSITSYNCRGLPKTTKNLSEKPNLIELFDTNDILLFQETWYAKQDLHKLNNLSNDFYGIGASPTDFNQKLIYGHPQGGVAILWRKNLNSCIEPLKFEYDWIVGISINVDMKKYIILCVYLPCLSNEHEEQYLNCLGVLTCILEELNCTCVSIIGDWNSDIKDKDHLFGRHLSDYVETAGLTISSLLHLPLNTYTYTSEVWGSNSFIDHCISTADGDSIIDKMEVLYENSTVDHVPMKIYVRLECVTVLDANVQSNYTKKIRWQNITNDQLEIYKVATSELLKTIYIPKDALSCKNMNCIDENHKTEISTFYNDVVCALKKGSSHIDSSRHAKSPGVRAGWSEFIADKYNISRECYILWRDSGKPRFGNVYNMMIRTKYKFKYALRSVKQNESRIIRDRLANNLTDKKPCDFWKNIKLMNKTAVPLANTVDGKTGHQEILKMWKDHFQTIFNCVENSKHTYSGTEKDMPYNKECVISLFEVENAIKNLKQNKSCGKDELYAEHLQFGSPKIGVLLSIMFTSFLVHGYLPDTFMDIVLVPVIKDKAGKLSDKDNYRPIALASVISKVFERIMLEKYLSI